MVCIPCIVIPVLLFIWHRFLQPIVTKFWNPFGKVKEDGENKTKGSESDTTVIADGKLNSCPFSSKEKKETEIENNEKENEDKKINNEILPLLKIQNMADESFPTSLLEFGYKFDDKKLKQIENDEPFKFVVEEDDSEYNQKHYEALGEIITQEVYLLLENEHALKKLSVPVDPKEKEPQTFIFVSDDYLNKDKLLILIHGSGVVRAGQWARRLIINDCLDSGTQIPFIERGLAEDYGILLMNTNDNCGMKKGKKKSIRGSEDPVSHGSYVWKHYVKKCKASKIFIVAHSFGGIVVTKLYSKFEKEFRHRVCAIAMTDSVHYISRLDQFRPLIQVSRNWVVSWEPLDIRIDQRDNDVPRVSAGCEQHEMTSWSSFDSIFKFFDKMNSRSRGTASDDEDFQDTEEVFTPSKKSKLSIVPSDATNLVETNSVCDFSDCQVQSQESQMSVTEDTAAAAATVVVCHNLSPSDESAAESQDMADVKGDPEL